MAEDRSTSLTPTPAATALVTKPPTTCPTPRRIASGPVRPGTILSPQHRDSFDRITAYLRRLAREKFYGTCAITLRNGDVEVVRTEQTLKVTEIPTTATPGDTAVALGTTTAVGGGR
jgi:hypothetical protein